MTLVFNFCALGATIICFEFFSRYFRYKETRTKGARDFYLAFFFVGLAYTFLSFPRLILFNPFWIQIAFILTDVSFLISMLLVGPTTMAMSDKWSRFKKTLFLIIFFWTNLYVFLNVIFFSPAVPLKANGIIYFWQSGTPWLQGMARGLLVVIALIISALFFGWAKKMSPKKIIFWRSFFGGLGVLIITIAGFILWFFPFFYFSPALLVLSGYLGILGFLIGWIGIGWIGGVVFRPIRKEFVKKIT